ncbi:phosphonate ABC transporter, permease protein PhnE [Streptomyces malaysiensis]|uniref:Phosphonate ABC transporter permease n=1 Tax=Streptomyces malaysiensis TaxID=92644 RepID=A0A7X5WWX4_STRMQ|nr:phosphonate ABC transporter, permease protein PhnE [Streptomyces malaysiensis]NIY62489.1 phosphonate ABC transporter permease [Streptomyces malaysiensis]
MSALGQRPPLTSTAASGATAARRTLARPGVPGMAAGLALLICLSGGIWAFIGLRLNIATLVDSAGNGVDFSSRMLPLDFPPAPELLGLLWQTLAIVITGTALSVVLSVPVALLAARNTTLGAPCRVVARAVIVLCRAVPDVVFAIAAFRVFGLGGMTGVVALGMHSVGMVGKLTADAVEQIDEGPRTALRAAGAGRLQQIAGAVLPQVLPSLIATALHRLDINLRVSVVLGFVGVGGIGYSLATAVNRLDYQRAMALALVVLLTCFAFESVSGAVRRTLLPQVTARSRRPRWRVPWNATVKAPPSAVARASGHPPSRTAVTSGGGTAAARPRTSPPWNAARVRRTVWLVLALALVVVSAVRSGVSWQALTRAADSLLPTLGDFLPPGTAGTGGTLLDDLWVTLRISFAGTLIGLVPAVLLGVLAAGNVVGSPRVARFFRTVILCVRGVPELILAIVLVVVTGLGPVAGALALGIGSIGLLGKLVADSLEEVEPGPVRALLATGARRRQVFFGSVLPRAWPAVVGHVLHTHSDALEKEQRPRPTVEFDATFAILELRGTGAGGGRHHDAPCGQLPDEHREGPHHRAFAGARHRRTGTGRVRRRPDRPPAAAPPRRPRRRRARRPQGGPRRAAAQ